MKGRDAEQLVNEVVLRTQAQAEYAAENYGHFGLEPAPLRAFHLADPPLRRPDRASRPDPRAQARRRTACPRPPTTNALAEIAAQISATERRAMVAERETNDRLIAHFLADRIGATFDGRISGVTRAGLFVKLHETGADGFVPARTIGDEYFRYDEAAPRHGRLALRRDLPARRPASPSSWWRPRRLPARCASSFCRKAAPGAGRGPPRQPRPNDRNEPLPASRQATEDTMTNDLGKLMAERMTKSERDQSFPDSEPRDAATLMLIDRSGPKPKVLLGRRHASHKFMPGKFVFPGGRIEALDRKMTAVSELHPDTQKKADGARGEA